MTESEAVVFLERAKVYAEAQPYCCLATNAKLWYAPVRPDVPWTLVDETSVSFAVICGTAPLGSVSISSFPHGTTQDVINEKVLAMYLAGELAFRDWVASGCPDDQRAMNHEPS